MRKFVTRQPGWGGRWLQRAVQWVRGSDQAQQSFEYVLILGVGALMVGVLIVGFTTVAPTIAGLACPVVDPFPPVGTPTPTCLS